MNVVLAMTTVARGVLAYPLPHRPVVAGMAVDPGVPSVEPEFSPRIMVEIPQGPGIRVVAGLALRSEPALVNVIVAMAFNARCRHTGEFGRQVTLFTGCNRVYADKGEPGHVVLETHLTAPALLAVAIRALLSLLAGMYVVTLMTVDALHSKRFVTKLAAVTGAAEQIRMSSVEWKFRLSVVIEPDLAPPGRAVAGVALFSVLPLVGVIIAMTAYTIRAQVLGEQLVAMTGIAVDTLMPARERKFGIPVVVEADLFPSGFTMAVGAHFTIPASMHII